ncbi:MAG: NAD(P)H-dependent oxidoreductase [Pseudomonadota bacterium]
MSAPNILAIQSSARKTGSSTRSLVEQLAAKLSGGRASAITVRDVADGVPFVDEAWVGANFTDPAERSEAQREKLAFSDALVAELKAAETIVIGVPIYNFGVPAALKAWVDMVARARVTFKYTENGPVGLLQDKKAYVVIASGGTKSGSEIDFATGYMRHVLGFLGITDVTFIAADQQMMHGEAQIEAARAEIEALPAAA